MDRENNLSAIQTPNKFSTEPVFTGYNRAELVLHETLGGLFDDSQQPVTNPVGTVTLMTPPR